MEQKNRRFIFDRRETEELTRLIVALCAHLASRQGEMRVLLAGDVRKGVEWVKMIDNALELGLKSAPYQPIGKSKVYEGEGLKIVVSELAAVDARRQFRLEYTNIVSFSTPSN